MQKLSQSLKYSPSVKKCSKRAYLRNSLESLIYLCTFSLLTVTPLDTWFASSCTRVTIWSVLCLSVTSYSSGCSTKLPMQGVTRCIASLERDLFCVASTGCHHAHLPCGLAGRHHDLLHLLHRACSGKLFPGLNLWLAREWSSDSFILLVPFESLEQAFLIFRRCPPLGDLWSLGRLGSHLATTTQTWWPPV